MWKSALNYTDEHFWKADKKENLVLYLSNRKLHAKLICSVSEWRRQSSGMLENLQSRQNGALKLDFWHRSTIISIARDVSLITLQHRLKNLQSTCATTEKLQSSDKSWRKTPIKWLCIALCPIRLIFHTHTYTSGPQSVQGKPPWQRQPWSSWPPDRSWRPTSSWSPSSQS